MRKNSVFRDLTVQPENSIVGEVTNRLRAAISQAGGAVKVSELAHVPRRSLYTLLNGGEIKLSVLIALARACNVSVQWLATGEEVPEPVTITVTEKGADAEPPPGPLHQFLQVPRYAVTASAGPGTLVEAEDVVGFMAFEEAFLRNTLNRRPEDLVSITAEGDSMDPTIRDGDILVIDKSVTDIQNSRIYVLEVDGRLLVKRIQLRLDGTLVVKSDNPKYEAEIVQPSTRNPLRIIGQVVYQAGPVR